jgi:hypothetical protein
VREYRRRVWCRLVWYREKIKTKEKAFGCIQKTTIFSQGTDEARALKVYHEEILSVSAPRERNSSGEGLDVAGFVCDVTTLSARCHRRLETGR